MIYTITLSPAVDRTVLIPGFQPGQVNRIAQEHREAGGKGINVARAVVGMDVPCLALGVAGGDAGAWLNNRLTVTGIPHDFVMTDAPTRTNLKVIDPDSSQTTDINEPGVPLPKQALAEVLTRADTLAGTGDHVVLSGSLPPGVTARTVVAFLKSLSARNVHVSLDAEGDLLRQGLRAHPFLIKPNMREFAALVGRELTEPNEIAAAARKIARDGTRVAVSMGERGAVYTGPEGTFLAHGVPVHAFSTVGAGDTMLAALVAGFAGQLPIRTVLGTAMAAGAACVARQPGEAIHWDAIFQQAHTVTVEEL